MVSGKLTQILNSKTPYKGKETAMAANYVCSVCGYEYEPKEHNNVAFEDLPDDWTCPVCGVGKDQFEKI